MTKVARTLEHVAFTDEDVTARGWARLKAEALDKLERAFTARMAGERGRKQPGRVFRFKLIEERDE